MRCLIVAFVLTTILLCGEPTVTAQSNYCAVPAPGQVFCDDFSDGSATDGMPVRWGMQFGGALSVDAESLVITNASPGFPAAGVVPARSYEDISIRAQVRLLEGNAIGFAVRRDVNNDRSYGGFIEDNVALIGIGGSAGRVLAEQPIGFDALSQDVNLRFDVFGNSLKLWAWPVGAVMPVVPTVTATDDEVESGSFFVWASSSDGGATNRSGSFRFVQVATQTIPEPSSALLSCLGFLSLLAWRKGNH